MDKSSPHQSSANSGEPEISLELAHTAARLGRILVAGGYISLEQLKYAARVKAKLGDEHSLLQVLKELEYITDADLNRAIRDNHSKLQLGSLLVELGLILPTDLNAALHIQREPANQGKRLGNILVEKRVISEEKLIDVLSNQMGYPKENPDFTKIDRELLANISPQWCDRFQIVPMRREGDKVVVAFVDPMDRVSRQAAEGAFNCEVLPTIATRFSVTQAIKAFNDSRRHVKDGPADAGETKATKLVNQIILDALEAKASDIHIEPMREMIRVRFRCDGVLILNKELSRDIAPLVISRLKVLCKADIAEKRRHQGGAFLFEHPSTGQRSDVRVSFYVTIFGEKVVMRLLSKKAELLDINEIGMAPRMIQRFVEDALDIPSGVVLITGPTGSGKTTTLYSCINYLNDMERSISTAEDPVEYVVDGIAQCSLDPKINMTFEETLRHMVRQDPDIIVLGEVRDKTSADAAIQAALTGHKVLTTFHTEDSIGGLLRLMNMNIETFLISSTVVSIVAQRLLRHVCELCAEPYRPTVHEISRLGLGQSDLANANFRQGRGCSHCHFTGYSGRVGVFELLVLNEPVKDALLHRKTSSEIRRISIETSGLITLIEDGLLKAAQGMTSLREVLRNLPRLAQPRPIKEIYRLSGISK